MILENTLKKASKILKENNINSHELDAEIILSHLMGVTKEFLITNNDTNIPKSINRKYEQSIKRRIKKEPVAYIIGKKEFWSESFIVNNSTLVPRPETEIMIYKIAKFFKDKKINVLDIGTPSDDTVTEAKIADDAVESEHLNDNIISGQTALTSAPADTDELLVSDAGTIKRIDYSLLTK